MVKVADGSGSQEPPAREQHRTPQFYQGFHSGFASGFVSGAEPDRGCGKDLKYSVMPSGAIMLARRTTPLGSVTTHPEIAPSAEAGWVVVDG
jgi:hypothetical protein